MTVFIVIHRSIHLLSLETNKTKIILYLIKTNKYMYSNTELAHLGHVHVYMTLVLDFMILGPAVHHTYECCWSTGDGQDAEPTATEWAGTVRGHAL